MSRWMQVRTLRNRDEKGAVAIMVSVTLGTVLLVFAAFAVDLGMQRVARRDAQAIADVVALDLARLLDGRTRTEIEAGGAGLDTLLAARDKSLARNPDAIGNTSSLQATPYLVDVDAQGNYPSSNGVPTQVGSADVPDGVVVVVSTDVDFAFSGVVGVNSGGVSRSAVGQQTSGACFLLGSYAARLNTDDSRVLGPLLNLLGSGINLGLVDYNGLADAEVSLLSLLSADLGVGTTSELIEGSELVGLGAFYLVTADVLENEGGNAASVSLLRAIAATVSGAQVRLDSILNVDTTGDNGLDSQVNVLNLVTAAAAAATGEAGLSLDNVGLNLGPLADVSTSASIIEPPQMGCGRAGDADSEASTSQVSVELEGSAANLDLGIARTSVELSGTVDVSKAVGLLNDIRCSPNPGLTVDVSGGLVDVDLELEVAVRIAGIPVVSGPIRITGQTTTSGQAIVEVIDDDYDVPATLPNTNSGLPALAVDTTALAVLGLPLGVGLSAVTDALMSGLVNPLIAGLDGLLTPLLSSLGVDVTGADVYAVRAPSCDQPLLVG